MLTWHKMWGLLLLPAIIIVVLFGLPVFSETLPGEGPFTLNSVFSVSRHLRESFLNQTLMSWLPNQDARSFSIWWSQTGLATESLVGVLIGLNLFALLIWPLFFLGELGKWVNNTYKRSWQRSVDLANK